MTKAMVRDGDFESLLSGYLSERNFTEGSVISGTIVKIDDKFVYVDINFKSLGRIPLYEFTNAEKPELNSEIEVVLTKLEGPDGNVCLSHEEVRKSEVKQHLIECFKTGEKVSGLIVDKKRPGYHVNLSGISAFLPNSLVDYKMSRSVVTDLQVNEVCDFVIMSMEPDCKNVVVSRRGAKEMDKKVAKREFIGKFTVGQIIADAVVTNITDYGAFVNIGDSHDGLLHINDMAWKKISHPYQILQKGDLIPQVKVLKIDEAQGHISLGLKQLEEDPWTVVSAKVQIGDVLDGIVSNLADYGAFIELPHLSIEGLAHVSELSWDSKNVKPSDVLNQGQKIKVKVLAINEEKKRISLSVKRCIKNPWDLVAESNPKGSLISGVISNINNFGISVDINSHVKGMIHTSDLSWTDEEGVEQIKNYKIGDSITAQVLAIDPEQHRMKLGIKQLSGNPYQQELVKLKVGDKVMCTTTEPFDAEIEVSFGNNLKGFIKRSELARDKEERKTEKFKTGMECEAQIISVNSDTGRVELSIRAIEEAEYTEGMNQFGAKKSPGSATLSDLISPKSE
jgi:small subunit ribosomal protein S1